MLARPGFRTSEFVVTVLTVVWYLVAEAANYVSTGNAVKLSLPAIAFIVSRGLAKYEARATPTIPGVPIHDEQPPPA